MPPSLTATSSLLSFVLLLLLVPAAHAMQDPDFIIVGGGTAGCALAARLCTALPAASIVLLERGKPRNATENFLVSAPRFASDSRETPVAEKISTAPNPGLLGRSVVSILGSTLGGTSAINGAQWNEPPRGTVETWGVDGLTTRRARRLFRRAFRTVGAAVPPEQLRHGLYREWSTAAAAVGLPRISKPFAGPRENGVFYSRVAISKAGVRADSCSAYVRPALQGSCRDRLQVIEGATVTKLLIARGKDFQLQNCTKKSSATCRCRERQALPSRFVRGVQYIQAGKTKVQTLTAKREVIVCAGPVGSPKLLQLSGIGPRELLRRRGLRVERVLPVGQHAQGRPRGLVLSRYTGVPLLPFNDPAVVLSGAVRKMWKAGKGGPLGVTTQSMTGYFERLALLEMTTVFGTRSRAIGQPLIVSLCLLDPESFGTIEIAGVDPLLPPTLKLNLFGAQGEAGRMARCVEKLRELHAALPTELGAIEILPGPGGLNETFLRGSVDNALHLVGGCALGSVTGPDFRVKGFANLRVVDSSVIPTMTKLSGPMSSVYMLAEHAAELMRRKYTCKGLGMTRE